MRTNDPKWVIPPVDRFWPKVLKTETCWLWQAQRNNRGYGCFYPLHGRLCYAHRFSWSLVNGPIPHGQFVLHRCDVPNCVNPDHLFIGDQVDNMRDCRSKGRFRALRGSAHRKARLTEADIPIIRADSRSGAMIARDYGIQRAAIYAIKQRRSWKHVP